MITSNFYKFIASAAFLLFACTTFAATYTAVQTGDWANTSTWDLNGTPQMDDNVIIPEGYTVNLPNGNTDMGTAQIDVYGTLDFGQSGKITLDASGVIYIVGNGRLTGSGNSAMVSIDGEEKWSGNDGDVVGDRAITTDSDPANSPNFLTPIPPQALLPIELIYFKAETKSSGLVEITWATASETNNDYFEVQRSRDGRNWNMIAEVEGALNSNQTINYNVTDQKAFNGRNFYRLVQFDTDGAYTVSDVVVASVSKEVNADVYPNPSAGAFNFSVPTKNFESSQINILNANGKLIKSITTGDQITSIDLTNESNGVYFYQIAQDQNIVSSGMIVKK